MSTKLSNETVLDQLRLGLAEFELVSSPARSISSHSFRPNRVPSSCPSYSTNLFFARIGGGVSPATKKIERYSVQKVTGDGRCLFRALVKGMAIHKGVSLNSREERENADELRTAVKEVICDSDKERRQYEEALVAITVEESLKRYCQRIGRSDFWGGESELLGLAYSVLSYNVVTALPSHPGREKTLASTSPYMSALPYKFGRGVAPESNAPGMPDRRPFLKMQHTLFIQVLSKLCHQPIIVYIPEHEHSKNGVGSGFIPIAEYGAEYGKGSRKEKPRKAVRLLYSGNNHYDLLL